MFLLQGPAYKLTYPSDAAKINLMIYMFKIIQIFGIYTWHKNNQWPVSIFTYTFVAK